MNLGMNMSTRLSYLLGLLAISGLLLAGFYFQYVGGLNPCPLCILQRFVFFMLGILFLLGILFYSKRWCRLFINSLSFITSILGITLAGRQSWLQHFPPPNSGECGASLQYMMQVLPYHEILQRIFQGTSECSQRGWSFLSLSMAEWALACFIGFLFLSIYLIWKELK